MSRTVVVWPGVEAHASGALWLPGPRVLAAADLHLGYQWAQRRKGELGPLGSGDLPARLIQVLDELKPCKLLLVGDIVHAPRPCEAEALAIAEGLKALAAKCELVAIRGNHDRQFARDFRELGISLVEEWRQDELVVAHGDRLPREVAGRLAIGHLHPAIGLIDAAGVRQRIPAFLVSGPVVVLPAMSPFAAGLDVWRSMPEQIRRLTPECVPEVIVATGTRAVHLGPLSRLLSPARGSRPADYRPSK